MEEMQPETISQPATTLQNSDIGSSAVNGTGSRSRAFTSLQQLDWLGAGLLLWMFLACCFPLYDTDLFWHLKTGELILQNWSIPGYDSYTYTDFGNRWIDLHWGFQVFMAVLYRLGGADLLILVKAGIITAALGIAYAAGGRGLSPWQRVLCWILPAIAISGRAYERPEIITVICLAGWLWIITRLEQRPQLIWWLPLLQVFWINFHALYILGLIVGTCYAVDLLIRYSIGKRWGLAPVSESLDLWTLFGVAFLCAIAAFINPYLEEGAFFPFELFRKFTVEQDFYSTRIGEFQMPIRFLMKYGFINLYLNAEVGLWVATAVSFVWLALRGRISIFRVLLFAGFSYLAWKASRNTNIFAMIAGFVLCENLRDMLQIRRSHAAVEGKPSRVSQGFAAGVGVLLAGMILAVVTGQWNLWAEKIRPFGVGETFAWYPHAAAKFMRQRGFPDRVFAAHFGVASVYTYYNAPQGKVFMDGRLEVCTKSTFKKFDEVLRLMAMSDPGWTQLVRDEVGSLPAIMLDTRKSRPAIMGVAATPGWKLVFADKSVAVFFEEGVADRLKLPLADPEPLIVPPQP